MKLVLAVLLLTLLLLQVRLWSGAGSLAHIDRLDREIVVQESDNAVLMERNEALRQEVNDLKNGMDSIEERARSRLGLIRRGETFILIVDKDTASTAQPDLQEVPEQAQGGLAASMLDENLMETLPPSMETDESVLDVTPINPDP